MNELTAAKVELAPAKRGDRFDYLVPKPDYGDASAYFRLQDDSIVELSNSTRRPDRFLVVHRPGSPQYESFVLDSRQSWRVGAVGTLMSNGGSCMQGEENPELDLTQCDCKLLTCSPHNKIPDAEAKWLIDTLCRPKDEKHTVTSLDRAAMPPRGERNES